MRLGREQCNWSCPHKRCTRLCHEPCDREPCNEPCAKRLGCGHTCIGLCGEPCPPVCRLCHADTVTEILFGSEAEPDARFVILVECRHVVEVTGMDQWMRSRNEQLDSSGDNPIQLPECPKCKTPLRRNMRYSNYIKSQLAAIEQVKLKSFGDPLVLATRRQQVSALLRQQPTSSSAASSDYLEKCRVALLKRFGVDGTMQSVSLVDLAAVENKWSVECALLKLNTSIESKLASSPHKAHAVYEFNKLRRLVNSTSDIGDIFYNQQRLDQLQREMTRLGKLIALFQLRQVAKAVPKQEQIQQLDELELLLVTRVHPMTTETEQIVHKLIETLGKRLQVPLTPEEKAEIVKAIGLTQGHWYKCRNGHAYAIGECGGAMERSRCPECGATIGGANHALAEGNAVATEMDGARFGAWSEQANNMANFRLD